MKTLTLFFTISVYLVQAQTFKQKFGTETDYKRLYYLNNQYIQSWIRSDTAMYNQLLWADDFVHQSGSSGRLFPKKQIAQEFGKPRFGEIEYFYADDIKIQFVSNDAALVFARPPYKGVIDKSESLSRYNDVYVRRNGAWICVSANITTIGYKTEAISKIPEKVSLISYHKGSENEIKILEELNTQHAKAFFESKPEILTSILADDYILLSENGSLYSKSEVLNQLKSTPKSSVLASYSIENLQIRFVSTDIAMIHAAAISHLKNGTMRGVQYNDIYINRNGKWLCVSGNNTPIR